VLPQRQLPHGMSFSVLQFFTRCVVLFNVIFDLIIFVLQILYILVVEQLLWSRPFNFLLYNLLSCPVIFRLVTIVVLQKFVTTRAYKL